MSPRVGSRARTQGTGIVLRRRMRCEAWRVRRGSRYIKSSRILWRYVGKSGTQGAMGMRVSICRCSRSLRQVATGRCKIEFKSLTVLCTVSVESWSVSSSTWAPPFTPPPRSSSVSLIISRYPLAALKGIRFRSTALKRTFLHRSQLFPTLPGKNGRSCHDNFA